MKSLANFVLLVGLLAIQSVVHSASPELDSLELLVNQGQLIPLKETAKAVFIADPTVASYQAPSSNTIFVFGKKAGITTLYILGKDEKVIYSRRIQVMHDVESLGQLINQQYPDADVQVTSTANRLILAGNVPSPDSADQVARLAEGFLSSSDPETVTRELINQLIVDLPTQVNIRIRVAEMDRETAREFGVDTNIDVQYAIPLKTVAPLANNLTATLKALESESLISILAEPNLTAVSGEEARFLAGGQFPVPLRSLNGEVSVEYRDYGITLDMTPTILSPNRISLKVQPSVSELSEKAAVEVEGLSIPAMTVRTASTTVELASGQSFVLGGLLHERENTIISQIPLLGDIPILGALFRSEKYVRKETELVIIATAFIVEPTDSDNFHIPQHGMEPYGDWQRFLYGKILKENNTAAEQNIEAQNPQAIGDYGFIY